MKRESGEVVVYTKRCQSGGSGDLTESHVIKRDFRQKQTWSAGRPWVLMCFAHKNQRIKLWMNSLSSLSLAAEGSWSGSLWSSHQSVNPSHCRIIWADNLFRPASTAGREKWAQLSSSVRPSYEKHRRAVLFVLDRQNSAVVSLKQQ